MRWTPLRCADRRDRSSGRSAESSTVATGRSRRASSAMTGATNSAAGATGPVVDRSNSGNRGKKSGDWRGPVRWTRDPVRERAELSLTRPSRPGSFRATARSPSFGDSSGRAGGAVRSGAVAVLPGSFGNTASGPRRTVPLRAPRARAPARTRAEERIGVAALRVGSRSSSTRALLLGSYRRRPFRVPVAL